MAKKDNYTAITEFEIIAPTNDAEVIGEKLALSQFGEYCPDNSLRGYSLLHLLDHPLHYRVSKIVLQGKSYIIPEDREKNYQPKFYPETMKYYLADKITIPDNYLKAMEYLHNLNDQVQEHGEIKMAKDHFYWQTIEQLLESSKRPNIIKLYTRLPEPFLLRVNIKKVGWPTQHLTVTDTTVENMLEFVKDVIIKQNISPFATGNKTTVELRETNHGLNGKIHTVGFKGIDPVAVKKLLEQEIKKLNQIDK